MLLELPTTSNPEVIELRQFNFHDSKQFVKHCSILNFDIKNFRLNLRNFL
jgi:hypothetical protein